MVAQKRFIAAQDWEIGIKNIAEANFIVKIGGQVWTFFSPSLDYACFCVVPRLGVGLSLGVSLPVDLDDMLSNLATQHLKLDQDKYTIEVPFSANGLNGGSVGSFEIGARGVIAGADGYQSRLRNNRGQVIARLRGGTVSLGLGVEVDMGSLSHGRLYGPYPMRTPATA